jgi:hypothetical protein
MPPTIPPQLQRAAFRFILVRAREKIPLERKWTTQNNYSFDDPKLTEWLEHGGNYGICSGPENLVVVDSDHSLLAERSEKCLGPTFRILSGSGRGFHDYFIVDGMKRKEIFERDGKHMGEAQFVGQMVVGPSSVHPSGNIYRITNDTAIKKVSAIAFRAAFRDFLQVPKTYEPLRNELSVGVEGSLQSLSLTAVLCDFKGVRAGSYIHGKNPWHGAKSGNNFTIDTSKNLWTCWRCHCGGGVARAIALMHGLLGSCPDRLSGAEYVRVVELAKEKHGWK